MAWRISLQKSLSSRNPPEVRVISGQNLFTDISYTVWQTFVWLFLIYSQKISFLSTTISKTNFETHKYWWSETDDNILHTFAQFLWALKVIFSSLHEKLFLVLFRATIDSLKLKLLDFLLNFVLSTVRIFH